MNCKTSLLAASAFCVAATLALPAMAQAVAAPAAPAAPATPAATPDPATDTSTTTTTSADSASDTTAGPSAPQPRARETVTVHRSITPNRPWLITGGAILVGTYVPTAVITGTQGRAEDSNLFIPVVGPWLNLVDRRCDGCAHETGNIAMVIGTGVLQGVGAGMTILSFFIPEKIAAATIEAGTARFQIAPTQVGRTGMGLGTVGVF